MKLNLISLLLFLLCSCTVDLSTRNHGPAQEVVKKGSIGKAELLDARISMPAGKLELSPSDTSEVVARLRYPGGSNEPNFKLDDTTFRARLGIDQSGSHTLNLKGDDSVWSVALPRKVETDLDLSLGAGEANLRLGELVLRKVALKLGAGEVKADFTGQPQRSYEVDLKGGVGECTVVLPAAAGIVATAEGGLGSIEVHGLDKKGDRWESANYIDSTVKIRVSVKGGIGKISIETR
jgi:hypothetical protein